MIHSWKRKEENVKSVLLQNTKTCSYLEQIADEYYDDDDYYTDDYTDVTDDDSQDYYDGTASNAKWTHQKGVWHMCLPCM